MEMKICTSVDLADLIMNVKFKFEKKIRNFDDTGVKFAFPIDFARGPYKQLMQRYRAACD